MSVSRRRRVMKLLLDFGFHSTMEVCAVEVGGAEGCRRLRELREEIEVGKHPGVRGIEKRRRLNSDQFEYCLLRENSGGAS